MAQPLKQRCLTQGRVCLLSVKNLELIFNPQHSPQSENLGQKPTKIAHYKIFIYKRPLIDSGEPQKSYIE